MKSKFTYPDYGTPNTRPEYTAHSGQEVFVVRQLTDDECDPECQPMYLIRASDGWEGHVDESELDPKPNIPDISDEDNAAFFNKHAPKIVEVLMKAAQDLCGKGPEIKYDPNEPMIQLDQGVVEIRCGIHEQKRIGGLYCYRSAFDIITYKVHNASRWHPEEIEDVPLATTEGIYNTAQRALVEWFNQNATGWFDAAGEAADYEECKQLLTEEE